MTPPTILIYIVKIVHEFYWLWYLCVFYLVYALLYHKTVDIIVNFFLSVLMCTRTVHTWLCAILYILYYFALRGRVRRPSLPPFFQKSNYTWTLKLPLRFANPWAQYSFGLHVCVGSCEATPYFTYCNLSSTLPVQRATIGWSREPLNQYVLHCTCMEESKAHLFLHIHRDQLLGTTSGLHITCSRWCHHTPCCKLETTLYVCSTDLWMPLIHVMIVHGSVHVWLF